MLKKLKKILSYNLKTLIKFEIIYKLVTTIIFVPLFLFVFKAITHLSGYNYLTFENVIPFLKSPQTIVSLFFLLIFMAFYTFIDISTIIIILDSSYQEKKISVKVAFIEACDKAKKIFYPCNILLPFFLIVLIPFLNIGLSSGLISTISIPEFIMDTIIKNKTLLSIFILLIIVLVFLLFRWLYSLHYFVLEDCHFKNARKKSINLNKNYKLKSFLSIILCQFLMLTIYFVFILLSILLIIGLFNLFKHIQILSNITITIIWLLIAFSFIIVTLLSTPINYAIISALYYNRKEKLNEEIMHIEVPEIPTKKASKKLIIIKVVTIILILISGTIFTYFVTSGKNNLKIEYVRTMEVTAHRGASVDYPENTMAAFKGAKKLGADWAELDVQQTKDQKLIVMHDTNLKRTTGVNKNTWETTYEEIAKLDAGSFFNKKFKNERIPLLEEVIKYAKDNNLKLNIELKPTGKEKDFEKSVVDLINAYNFKDYCVVTSQVYEVLENIKKYEKDIKTVYVMSLAYGDITKLTAADSFSIEESSINKTLVKKIHNSGKEVYAWTVNNKENISHLIELNVDNIITDNITLAKETIYSSKTSNLIQEYVKFITELFS